MNGELAATLSLTEGLTGNVSSNHKKHKKDLLLLLLKY